MKSSKIWYFLLIFVLLAGCGGSGSQGGAAASASPSVTPSLTPSVTPQGSNVLSLTVNGSLCTNNAYPNKPCVSVTVCSPNTTTCQTINDIVLDTGSYGLRIFKQVLNVPLTPVTSGAGVLAECVQYGGGTSQWGPVQTASVILGNEPAIRVPIHVIDATLGSKPISCQNADLSPAAAGFNGILGVGYFAQDCGTACANGPVIGRYYTCSGTGCTPTAAPLANQVQNPISLLPLDNNGLIIQLPAVPGSGSPAVNGSVVLGIGTQANNIPGTVASYPVDQKGNFTTVFNGISYTASVVDTGSNGLFFPRPRFPACAAPNNGWYCPAATASLTATIRAATGVPTGTVDFQVANFNSLFSGSNSVYPDIAGTTTGQFLWGLPFFFGREVYLGIEGKASSLGTGPYWGH